MKDPKKKKNWNGKGQKRKIKKESIVKWKFKNIKG